MNIFRFACCIATLVTVMLNSNTLAQEIEWIRRHDGPYRLSRGISLDGQGNSYITGRVYSALHSVDEDLNRNAFVSKFDAEGSLDWTRQLGTSQRDEAQAISVDELGNVFISGFTAGSIDRVNTGFFDAFVSKYNTEGNLAWTRQLGAFEGWEEGRSVSADGLGNVFLSGFTTGVLGGDDGTASGDAFVAKYDTDGNLSWTRQFEFSSYAVSADGLGSIFVAGIALSDTTLDRKSSFVNKYDTEGNLEWVRYRDPAFDERIYDISTDRLGNVFITGEDSFISPENPGGSAGAYVSKYDTTGNLEWTRRFGGGPQVAEFSPSISADGNGNVFISGLTYGLTFPYTGDNNEVFVRKYDTEGNLDWIYTLDPEFYVESLGVSADGKGSVFFTGNSKEPNQGGAFVAKLTDLTYIPEPSSALLLFTGLATLAMHRREQLVE